MAHREQGRGSLKHSYPSHYPQNIKVWSRQVKARQGSRERLY